MKINISKLLDSSQIEVKVNTNLTLGTIEFYGKKLKFSSETLFDGGVYKADKEIFISGNLAYEYVDTCDRCLKKFSVKKETYVNTKVVKNNEELQQSEELATFCENNNVDLEEVIINTILLDLPMKTICDENCKGFCGKCGKNLNEGQCDCDDIDIDPRLAKLKELMD